MISSTAATSSVPFAKLLAVDEINARAATREGLDELAASIEAKGLIQPLAVRPAAQCGRFEIIDGRRRYLAIARLVKAKVWTRDVAVPVLVREESDLDALETSLMANTVRLPMHPVDQHEVFARLSAQGLGQADIATRFGLAERTVRQHLALGALAPEVRAAWRKGKIDAEAARAFAAHSDAGVQADVLKRLGGRVDAWRVRQELADHRVRVDLSDEMALVGEEAYRAAGGKIDDDLFDDARYVADVPLVKKLARERLAARCQQLIADGWSWALIADDVAWPDWRCDHVRGPDSHGDIKPEDYTVAERARSGCMVSIDTDFFDGTAVIQVLAGLIPPAGRSASTQIDLEDLTIDDDEPGRLPGAHALADDDQPEEAAAVDEFGISQALYQDLTAAQTKAAAEVLALDRDLALRVAIAALSSFVWESPAKLVIDQHAHDRRQDESSFTTILRRHGDEVLPVLADRLAAIVAQSLQLSSPSDFDGRRALVDALDPNGYVAAMRRAFSSADYFKRARKETAIAALEEMHQGGAMRLGLMSRADLEAMKKGDLATWAAEQAAVCGWLPPQLRHAGYGLVLPEAKLRRGKMAAAEQGGDATPAEAPARRRKAAP
jgi:ParB family transcriptional regulator, chromosome partitioning protein